MRIKIGILGLPNVGKSTLFNALTQKSLAHAANFPFCTIEPNIAPVPFPDSQLELLGQFANSKVLKPAMIDWMDVAGLAKGAHRGEGLGNRFLATLRECDALCHVVRTFEDSNVIHVDSKVDPVADAEVINLELIFADLAHVERRLEKKTCDGIERAALERIVDALQGGIPARNLDLSGEELISVKSMGLLTLKPVLYAFNTDDLDFFYQKQAMLTATSFIKSIKYCNPLSDRFTVVSAKLEDELSKLESAQAREKFLINDIGVELDSDEALEDLLSYKKLPRMIQQMLDLQVVYTGPGVPPQRSQTSKSYLVRNRSVSCVYFAGRLHGDIQKGFIRAEVTQASDLLKYTNYAAAKEAGCVRTEGRDYILKSEDVVLIKWK